MCPPVFEPCTPPLVPDAGGVSILVDTAMKIRTYIHTYIHTCVCSYMSCRCSTGRLVLASRRFPACSSVNSRLLWMQSGCVSSPVKLPKTAPVLHMSTPTRRESVADACPVWVWCDVRFVVLSLVLFCCRTHSAEIHTLHNFCIIHVTQVHHSRFVWNGVVGMESAFNKGCVCPRYRSLQHSNYSHMVCPCIKQTR